MEITLEALEQKSKALTQEIITFSRTAQAEINALQNTLQNKVRDSQKKVDNLEGKLASLQELIAQIKGEKAPATKPEANETGKTD